MPDEYKGKKSRCDFCRAILPLDGAVMWDSRQDLVFCFPESGLAVPNCAQRWVVMHGKFVAVLGVTFRGRMIAECSGCGRKFSHEETIHVDRVQLASISPDAAQGIAFCDATLEDCIEGWKGRIGQPAAVYQLEPQIFYGNT